SVPLHVTAFLQSKYLMQIDRFVKLHKFHANPIPFGFFFGEARLHCCANLELADFNTVPVEAVKNLRMLLVAQRKMTYIVAKTDVPFQGSFSFLGIHSERL